MPPSKELHALHTYYLRASTILEDLKTFQAQQPPDVASKLIEMKLGIDIPADRLLTQEIINRLSVFYGLVYVVIEGFQELGLRDPQLEQMLTGPNLDILRRYRNAMFHFQSDFYESEKVMAMLEGEDTADWMRAIWRELNRWFSDNLVGPFLASFKSDAE